MSAAGQALGGLIADAYDSRESRPAFAPRQYKTGAEIEAAELRRRAVEETPEGRLARLERVAIASIDRADIGGRRSGGIWWSAPNDSDRECHDLGAVLDAACAAPCARLAEAAKACRDDLLKDQARREAYAKAAVDAARAQSERAQWAEKAAAKKAAKAGKQTAPAIESSPWAALAALRK